MARTMLVKLTGATHVNNFSSNLSYLGSHGTLAHGFDKNRGANPNGVRYRDLAIGGLGVRTDTLQHTKADFEHVMKKRPDLKVKTYEYVISPSADTFQLHFNHGIPDHRTQQQAEYFLNYSLRSAHRAWPNHQIAGWVQADNSKRIMHCHVMVGSMSLTPPYQVTRGNQSSSEHFARACESEAKAFDRSQNVIRLGEPITRRRYTMTALDRELMTKLTPIVDKASRHELNTRDFQADLAKAGVSMKVTAHAHRVKDSKGNVVYLRHDGHYVYHTTPAGNKVKTAKKHVKHYISIMPVHTVAPQSEKAVKERVGEKHIGLSRFKGFNKNFDANRIYRAIKLVDKEQERGEYVDGNVRKMASVYPELNTYERKYLTNSLSAQQSLGRKNLARLHELDDKYGIRKIGTRYLPDERVTKLDKLVDAHEYTPEDLKALTKKTNLKLDGPRATKASVDRNVADVKHVQAGLKLYNGLDDLGQRVFRDEMFNVEPQKLSNDVQNVWVDRKGQKHSNGDALKASERSKISRWFDKNQHGYQNYLVKRNVLAQYKEDKKASRHTKEVQEVRAIANGRDLYASLSNAGRRYFRAYYKWTKYSVKKVNHALDTPLSQESIGDQNTKLYFDGLARGVWKDKHGNVHQSNDAVSKPELKAIQSIFHNPALQSKYGLRAFRKPIDDEMHREKNFATKVAHKTGYKYNGGRLYRQRLHQTSLAYNNLGHTAQSYMKTLVRIGHKNPQFFDKVMNDAQSKDPAVIRVRKDLEHTAKGYRYDQPIGMKDKPKNDKLSATDKRLIRVMLMDKATREAMENGDLERYLRDNYKKRPYHQKTFLDQKHWIAYDIGVGIGKALNYMDERRAMSQFERNVSHDNAIQATSLKTYHPVAVGKLNVHDTNNVMEHLTDNGRRALVEHEVLMEHRYTQPDAVRALDKSLKASVTKHDWNVITKRHDDLDEQTKKLIHGAETGKDGKLVDLRKAVNRDEQRTGRSDEMKVLINPVYYQKSAVKDMQWLKQHHQDHIDIKYGGKVVKAPINTKNIELVTPVRHGTEVRDQALEDDHIYHDSALKSINTHYQMYYEQYRAIRQKELEAEKVAKRLAKKRYNSPRARQARAQQAQQKKQNRSHHISGSGLQI